MWLSHQPLLLIWGETTLDKMKRNTGLTSWGLLIRYTPLSSCTQWTISAWIYTHRRCSWETLSCHNIVSVHQTWSQCDLQEGRLRPWNVSTGSSCDRLVGSGGCPTSAFSPPDPFLTSARPELRTVDMHMTYHHCHKSPSIDGRFFKMVDRIKTNTTKYYSQLQFKRPA